jgi:Pyruvate/2-oxoacid:ferredoxin oxidoreductase delta subunit
MGTFERLLREGGYAEALKGLDVEVRPFKETVRVDIGEPFGRIEIAREALAADVVVNLPKLKTHTQMLLTVGVKNLFGCIVGLKKPEWHMRSGVDRHMFARLLVQICATVNPAATLVDGILGMEGQGPGRSGVPRRLGLLVGGASAPAVDAAVCRMVGIAPGELPTHRAAVALNLVTEDVEVVGDFVTVARFKLPVLAPLTFGPQRFHRLMRKHLVQRPAVDPVKCRLCGECWRICPAKAITPYARTIGFDYDHCIRCYCCVEMCPHGALAAVETQPGRIVRRLAGLRDHIAVRIGKRGRRTRMDLF